MQVQVQVQALGSTERIGKVKCAHYRKTCFSRSQFSSDERADCKTLQRLSLGLSSPFSPNEKVQNCIKLERQENKDDTERNVILQQT
jgi:hypothetical protein